MRSLFNAAPFSRFDLGRHILRGGLGAPRLGQQMPSIYALEDYAQKIEGLTDTKVKEDLRKQYAECRDKEGTSQIACYAILGAKVYEALKNEGRESTLPPPVMTAQPKAPEFPIIPVVLAVAGAGALIYFLATMGKKKG
jgi:hypothetical protein